MPHSLLFRFDSALRAPYAHVSGPKGGPTTFDPIHVDSQQFIQVASLDADELPVVWQSRVELGTGSVQGASHIQSIKMEDGEIVARGELHVDSLEIKVINSPPRPTYGTSHTVVDVSPFLEIGSLIMLGAFNNLSAHDLILNQALIVGSNNTISCTGECPASLNHNIGLTIRSETSFSKCSRSLTIVFTHSHSLARPPSSLARPRCARQLELDAHNQRDGR